MIWKCDFSSGRVVELAYRIFPNHKVPQRLHEYVLKYVRVVQIYDKSRKVEHLLSICRESRSCTLKILKTYENCFEFYTRHNYYAALKKGHTFLFRPETDIMYLSLTENGSERLLYYDIFVTPTRGSSYSSIRYFAVDYSLLHWFLSKGYGRRHNGLLSALHQLILVGVPDGDLRLLDLYNQPIAFRDRNELKASLIEKIQNQHATNKVPEIIFMSSDELKALM